MSKVKTGLTVFYWLTSLAFIAGAVFMLFGGPDLLKQAAKPPPAPPAVAPPPPVALTAPAEKSAEIIYEDARTSQPLGSDTRFYKKKEFLAGDARRKHTLTYYLYAPAPPYPPELTFPLVVVLHDIYGRAHAGEYLIEGNMPVKYPAFVVVPVLSFGKRWAMPRDIPEIPNYQTLLHASHGLKDAAQLVSALKKSYPIDRKRVYVIGCADGGFGAFGAALRYPDTFAAAVPINGGWTASEAKGFSKVPLWVFHGAENTYSPSVLSRGAVSYIKAYGGKANYTEVPGVGNDCGAPQFYTPTLWKWLFNQHK
ncbi:MAG: hypothetical protein ACAH83_05760 [Alphaproteobacteria bacterium]